MCAVASSNGSRERQPPITDSLETAVISFLLSPDISRNQALGHPYLFNLHSHHQDGPSAQRRKQSFESLTKVSAFDETESLSGASDATLL